MAAFSIDEWNARLFVVTGLRVMAVGGTVVDLVAGWRHWRRGLAVEGISPFLAMLGLWLVGFIRLLVLATLISVLVAVLVGLWRRQKPERGLQ